MIPAPLPGNKDHRGPQPGRCGPRRRLLSQTAGMTLLEVMVAMGIAAIVLVAVYRLQTQSIGMEGVAAFHTQAPLLARQVLAAVERQGPDYPSTDSGDFGADYPGYGWTADTGDVPDFVDPSGRALLKQIDIRIHLNQDQDVFALRTFRLVTAGD